MISFTPWYIILGEFGIVLALTLLARTLRRGSERERPPRVTCRGGLSFCSFAAENVAQFAFGAFQNVLLLLWKIFPGAIDVEVQHRHC